MTIYEDMLSAYTNTPEENLRNAEQEVIQQIALAGLYRGGFFQ